MWQSNGTRDQLLLRHRIVQTSGNVLFIFSYCVILSLFVGVNIKLKPCGCRIYALKSLDYLCVGGDIACHASLFLWISSPCGQVLQQSGRDGGSAEGHGRHGHIIQHTICSHNQAHKTDGSFSAGGKDKTSGSIIRYELLNRSLLSLAARRANRIRTIKVCYTVQ